MRTERDFLGEVQIGDDALYGIHAVRARGNFPATKPFSQPWYRATGTVKQACYLTLERFAGAVKEKYPHLLQHLRIPEKGVISALIDAAGEVADGKHFDHFIVPALQGGAGTSINMNINEIIANRALVILGEKPGNYEVIDPIETANLYQSTNDVIPTGLRVAAMRLLNELEEQVNLTRTQTEQLEQQHRNSLRIAYTQMQEAVPSTFGVLFSAYSDALSRDWWRVSKASERIKQVSLGGGATGTALSVPRFFVMEATAELRKLTGLPLAQGENLTDITSNLDPFVEVHAILKAHAVNLEKVAADLRILSAGTSTEIEIHLPEKQAGSSIMPGKVNPVIPEYIISSAHRVYAADQEITALAGQGCLELNAYLPSVGHRLLESLEILAAMNISLREHLLKGLVINTKTASKKLFSSPAVTTALSPFIGYHAAAELARQMKANDQDIFEANRATGVLTGERLKTILTPSFLLKKGFTLKDVDEISKDTGQ